MLDWYMLFKSDREKCGAESTEELYRSLVAVVVRWLNDHEPQK